jgi:alkylhydroperoxidase family enzyme
MRSPRPIDPSTVAPEALAAFDLVRSSARAAVDGELYALARARIATLLGVAAPGGNGAANARIAALPSWPDSPLFGERERACLAFAEQFVLDVSGVTDEQRGALAAALGADAAAFAQALYAIDFELRLRAAFTALLGADPLPVEPAAAPEKLWPALEAMMPLIARLAALDPMTTELIRLRGARAHQCRVCKSLRNVRAVEAGGSEAFFDQIDRYEQSDFSERHKLALRTVDAILWRPGDFPAGLAEQVRAQWSGEQIVEIVLDVTRNALNKFAVAMGVDGIGVGEGIGYYDTDARGELVYGLTPAAR